MWPEEAIGVLEAARAAVREQRAVSIEAALKGQEAAHEPSEAFERGTGPGLPAELAVGDSEAVWAILEELGALRELVREQNERIASLEEVVRSSRELPAGEDLETPAETQDDREWSEEGYGTKAPFTNREEAVGREERGAWRRVLDWFGL